MTNSDIELPPGDWPVSFDAVRVAQHLRFRALPQREKIQAMEDMAELVAHFRRQREAALTAGPSPQPSPRERGEEEDRG
ncbi:hypothetical protein [Sinimarinibacterium flocculans]|uniref:Uncharacterized protein n=1 Tax=Sinimarinibacterium flocculans TaxID=985250 RepID=A0A318E6R4_9GAMM|nr:hypothetical protein [Sinimarinibacterium flocculans]PXV64835.1 hypothetical protein C8D93_1117 [Sinimarinibacterium flocculans]